MPGGHLPEGLVTTNNETVGEEIGNVDRVDLADVARLWRDYSTSRALLHDNTGERLANFFWRIWSNPAVSQSIPGSTVARLFMTISAGGDRVRTTPVPSPRSTSPASRDTTPTPSSPHPGAELLPPPDRAPVLALPPSAVADAPTSAATAPAGVNSAPSASQSASTASQSPPSPSGPRPPTSPTTPIDRSSSSGNRKRAGYVTASGARAKTKPSLPRRKSSQGASATTGDLKRSPRLPPRPSPPRSPSSRPLSVVVVAAAAATAPRGGPVRAPPPGVPSIPSIATSFALPSTSWQDVSSPASSQIAPPAAAATPQQPSSWLVDTNFRSRFVEKSRGTSSTNLPGLGQSRSTVRFADQLPGRRATSGAADTPLAAPAPSATRDTATTAAPIRRRRDSRAVADDDDDDDAAAAAAAAAEQEEKELAPLPRTKSQLSMMIERERRKSGTHELRPNPLLQPEARQGRARDRASRPNDTDPDPDKDEDGDDGEDDLLMMGRRDGVTKAGTVRNTARAKQRSSPQSRDQFRYQSPPPPPLY